MTYEKPDSVAPIDQEDLVDGCPTLSLKDYDPDGLQPPQIQVAPSRVLVLTQTCDLANRKVSTITVAVALDAQSLVDQGLLKAADIRGPIRGGRVFSWYFLPRSEELGLPEMIVDLRQLHTVRLDVLVALCGRGGRRARFPSPYRDHLAKHFADTFSRIGLPESYDSL